LQASQCALYAIGVLACGRTHVDHRMGFFRYDVRPAAARYDTHVDTDASVEILKPLDRDNLRGQFVYRARTFAGIQTGMRGDAAHRQIELAASFPRGLQCPSGQCRLEHQHGGRLLRYRLDGRTGSPTSNFLIGGPEHDQRGMWSPGCLKRPNRKQSDGDSAFHVECARTEEGRTVPVKRHPFKRPDRPDRVEMPEQQNRFPLTAHFCLEVVPAV
jgi:hypothetical protein